MLESITAEILSSCGLDDLDRGFNTFGMIWRYSGRVIPNYRSFTC
jgi:hypothetical protein